MRLKKIVTVFSKVVIFLLPFLLLTPILSMFLSDSLKRHTYHEVSFEVIARNELPQEGSDEAYLTAAMEFIQENLWLFPNSHPYDGKPFDYLVTGIGWCDYYAQVLCELAAVRGIAARYSYLVDKNGVSPHTVVEVYLDGAWRACDPYFNLIFSRDGEPWRTLEEVTPQLVAGLADVRLASGNEDAYRSIIGTAERVYPLPNPPQRSDNFLEEKHILDWVARGHVKLFGPYFSHWVQDRYLAGVLPEISNPIERLWVEGRSFHLYGRFLRAEQLYWKIFKHRNAGPYRERAALFLTQILIRQERFKEARDVLAYVLEEKPNTEWAHFYLGDCYAAVGDEALAAAHYIVIENAKLYGAAAKRLARVISEE